MGKTNAKGEIGEAMILADLQRQGHGIAIPFGHDLPFDLIVVRKENGALEKVQCKYTTSNGRVVVANVIGAAQRGWRTAIPGMRSTGSAFMTRRRTSASISRRWFGMAKWRSVFASFRPSTVSPRGSGSLGTSKA